MSFKFWPTEPTLIHSIILYHKETGEIKHIHTEVFFGNESKLDKNEMDKAAFGLAKKRIDNDENNIKALHLQNFEFKEGAEYIVDINRSVLVDKKQSRQ